MAGFKTLFTAALAATASAVKIMALGDSITEITCWRTMLQDKLASAGLTTGVQWVGSMTNNPQNCQGSSNWDRHHEGHSGYKAVDIANNNLRGWLANTKPDIIMFMLGTNDVPNTSTNSIIAAYTKMVQLMRDANPNVRIIIDKLIPLPWTQSNIDAINAQIPSWASSHSTTRSPIYVVDCATGFSNSWLRDGIHPSLEGDRFIADRLFPVVSELLGGGASGPGTTTTTTQVPPITTATPPPITTTTLPDCAPKWGQCGGNGWTGPTCCASGSTCKFSNAWYSQCV